MPRYFWFLLLALTYHLPLQAQWSSQRVKWVHWQSGAIEADTLTIVPNSFKIIAIAPENLPPDAFTATVTDQNQIQLMAKEGADLPDSIQVSYRVLPLSLHKPYFHRSQAVYDTGGYRNHYQELDVQALPPTEKEELFPTSGLQKSGSISRGISAGNNQDVFINSALNLQLEGQLTDDVAIQAVITDRNVPFQPEGNTQQIQEFDRIYLELKHERASLRAGDILLRNDSSVFMRYFKNVQGGQIAVNTGDSSQRFSSTTNVGGAVAKGQFFNYQMEVREGVMGPYRLYGPNNERNIIVIAGSEKVFLDGKPLERGYNYDYVIDYNLAEITFTTQVLITRYSRVRIEFEYATQNYNRSIVQMSHRQRIGKLELYGGAYQEKDSKQNPLFFQLDEETERQLASLGDSANFALIRSTQEVPEFSPDQMLYTRQDTTVDGELFTGIWVRATQLDSTFYRVNFVETGPNSGHYILERNTANGRTYRWVAPLGGMPQGNFTPGKVLVPPNMKRMVTAGGKMHLSQKDYFFAEVAFSEQDKNLFSTLDANDDKGHAVKVGYRNQGRPVSFLEGYKWTAAIDFEADHRNFNAIDRFRTIEFDRDWSLTQAAPAEDRIFNAGVGLLKDADNHISYQLSRRRRENKADGYQHKFRLDKKLHLLQVRNEGFWLENDLGNNRSEWGRLRTDVSIRQKFIVPGYAYTYDRNQVFNPQTDSVLRSAMNFEEHQFYLENGDSLKVRFRAAYSLRKDRIAQAGRMINADDAETLTISADKNGKKGSVRLLLNYRKVRNRQLEGQPTEENLSGRLDWRQHLFDKHIYSELTYSTASGQELQREFVFLRVDNGLGTHTWRDDNGDGVQDLGEFYPAILPDEKNYAKFFVPTDEYLAAFNTNINYRLRMEAPRSWLSESGLKRFLGRFSSVSSVSIRSRITDDSPMARLLPMFANISPDQLLSNASIIQSSFFFNRKDPNFGIEARVNLSENKQLLTNGFEGRNNYQYAVFPRWNIKKELALLMEAGIGELSSFSDFLADRNYRLDLRNIKTEISYQPGPGLRFATHYEYKEKSNLLGQAGEVGETAFFHEVSLQGRWAKTVKMSLNTHVRMANIQFNGQENTPLGYEMLEALRPGQNFTWTVNWVQRLSNGLQLNLAYNGRKSPEQKVAHLGRMQITALF